MANEPKSVERERERDWYKESVRIQTNLSVGENKRMCEREGETSVDKDERRFEEPKMNANEVCNCAR
jgi:hypothetical protein